MAATVQRDPNAREHHRSSAGTPPYVSETEAPNIGVDTSATPEYIHASVFGKP
jgi:hypothetical protein